MLNLQVLVPALILGHTVVGAKEDGLMQDVAFEVDFITRTINEFVTHGARQRFYNHHSSPQNQTILLLFQMYKLHI